MCQVQSGYGTSKGPPIPETSVTNDRLIGTPCNHGGLVTNTRPYLSISTSWVKALPNVWFLPVRWMFGHNQSKYFHWKTISSPPAFAQCRNPRVRITKLEKLTITYRGKNCSRHEAYGTNVRSFVGKQVGVDTFDRGSKYTTGRNILDSGITSIETSLLSPFIRLRSVVHLEPSTFGGSDFRFTISAKIVSITNGSTFE